MTVVLLPCGKNWVSTQHQPVLDAINERYARPDSRAARERRREGGKEGVRDAWRQVEEGVRESERGLVMFVYEKISTIIHQRAEFLVSCFANQSWQTVLTWFWFSLAASSIILET